MRAVVDRYLHHRFGVLLESRPPREARFGASAGWEVGVAARCSDGELDIATLRLDERGRLIEELSPLRVVDAIRTSTLDAFEAPSRAESMDGRISAPPEPPAPVSAPAPSKELAPVAKAEIAEPDFDFDLGDAAPAQEAPDDPEALREEIRALVERGDPASLLRARDLSPRLLVDGERLGITLMKMVEIERRLGDTARALEFLTAAARDFSDRFKMGALERCAAMGITIVGREAFAGSPIHRLLSACRQRLRPLASVVDAPGLAALRPEEKRTLGARVTHRMLTPGEVLLERGAPSRNVFIVKSGLIAVSIPTPTGGTQLVRCCYPGWLLGESSVLVADDPRANATLRADGVAEIWAIDGQLLRELMAGNAALAERVAATKHIQATDSFLTLHPTVGYLELQVRDGLLECVRNVAASAEARVLYRAGEVPPGLRGRARRGHAARARPRGPRDGAAPPERARRDARHDPPDPGRRHRGRDAGHRARAIRRDRAPRARGRGQRGGAGRAGAARVSAPRALT